eukprot:COSAG02_NODE_1574_length_11880_cov_13.431675_8_plen_300_part_00
MCASLPVIPGSHALQLRLFSVLTVPGQMCVQRGSGECHLGLERWANASASFAAALAERPGDGAALHGRGCARWGEGKTALAWADFYRATVAGYELAAGPQDALASEVSDDERLLALEMSHRDDTEAASRTMLQRSAAAKNREKQAAARHIQSSVRRRSARKKAQQEAWAEIERRALGRQLETLMAAQTEQDKDAQVDVRALLGVPLPRKLWQTTTPTKPRQPRPQPQLTVSRDQAAPCVTMAVAPLPRTPAERALAMLEEQFNEQTQQRNTAGDAQAEGGTSEGNDAAVVQPWVGVWRP